jgi:hypothetical protein
MRAGPCRFYLVAPVTQTEASDQWAAGGLDGGVIPGAYKIARTLAQGRLQHELNRLREAGADADGEVVDPHPIDAIRKLVPCQATSALFEGGAWGRDFRLVERSHNEAWVGCTVWSTTVSSSAESVSRSTSSRSRTLKASTVLAAS